MRILFYDIACPAHYDGDTLRSKPLGGSEATCIRIAEGLASRGHSVHVWTHKTETPTEKYGVHYSPVLPDRVDNVVILRSEMPITELRIKYPDANMLVWLHDLAGRDIALASEKIADARVKILGVSMFHRTQIIEALRSLSPSKYPQVDFVYNPVDPTLRPDSTQPDKNKIVFFSSPHKGLVRTLEVFVRFSQFDELKDVRLCVANPGYLPDVRIDIPNIVNLGSLAHHEVMRHVRESLCVFHLNRVFPETFGLVYAEAQAVGTPFITHDVGAVREISDHPAQFVDVNDTKEVIKKVIGWRSGYRPSVRLDSRFRTPSILKDWSKHLALTSS